MRKNVYGPKPPADVVPFKLPATTIGRPPRSFQQMMELVDIDDNTYQQASGSGGGIPVRENGRTYTQSYGGFVLAQASVAATRTVADGFVLHSCFGYWISSGFAEVPFIYHVQRLKEGKNYCIRRVDATHPQAEDVRFTLTCSFKKPDKSLVSHQVDDNVRRKYASLIDGFDPSNGPELRYDSYGDFMLAKNTRGWTKSIPAAKFGVFTMDEYNKGRNPTEKTDLLYYTAAGDMPIFHNDRNFHMCNHIYNSDRWSGFGLAGYWNVLDRVASCSSLSTSVVFHTPTEACSMLDSQGNERWFVQEQWTDRYEDGRATLHSRLWDDQGRHIATTFQECMIQLRPDAETQKTPSKI